MKNAQTYDKTYTQLQAQYFADLRKKTGRTLEDVAYFIDLKKQTYYHYERGKREMPMSTFIDLCRFYNLNYAEVFKYLNKITEEACGRNALEEEIK